MVLKLSQKGQKVHLFALEPDVHEGEVSNIAETEKSQSKGKGKGGQRTPTHNTVPEPIMVRFCMACLRITAI